MKCPCCASDLSTVCIREVELNVCDHSCGGIWFDNRELEKFDEPHEAISESLLRPSAAKSLSSAQKRMCPRCPHIVLFKRFSSLKRQIQVDQCGKCNGLWLDAGELASVRLEYNTEAERKKAAEDFTEKVARDSLKEIRDQSKEDLANAQRISNFLKFICPSYHIPGKQKGGAF